MIQKPYEFPVLPAHAPGMRIGLLGGSFNPPHIGHRHISLIALKRLKLDRVWWLVSPGNPLKDTRGLYSVGERAEASRFVSAHPKIDISTFEETIDTHYTFDTLKHLLVRGRGLDFVWLMGADNLAGFHRWDHWDRLARMVPFAVIDRPGCAFKALASPAAKALEPYRVDEADAALLPMLEPPAWSFVFGPRSDLSSTALRREDGDWHPWALLSAHGVY